MTRGTESEWNRQPGLVWERSFRWSSFGEVGLKTAPKKLLLMGDILEAVDSVQLVDTSTVSKKLSLYYAPRYTYLAICRS